MTRRMPAKPSSPRRALRRQVWSFGSYRSHLVVRLDYQRAVDRGRLNQLFAAATGYLNDSFNDFPLS
jgi:hypothetical protein